MLCLIPKGQVSWGNTHNQTHYSIKVFGNKICFSSATLVSHNVILSNKPMQSFVNFEHFL